MPHEATAKELLDIYVIWQRGVCVIRQKPVLGNKERKKRVRKRQEGRRRERERERKMVSEP